MGLAFARAVERRPDATGIVDIGTGTTYTYAEWGEEVKSIASALNPLGIGPGDRVAVMMVNRKEMATLYWAT